MMRVITLASPSGLARARALARSLNRHQPDWPHEVLLMAGPEVARRAGHEEGTPALASVCRDLDLDLEALLALHPEEELTALLVPSVLRRYAERTGEPVVHLPASVWILGPLEPLADALSPSGVVLVPRMRGDLPKDGLEPTPAAGRRAGRIDQTLMAVDPGAEAQAFLEWWEQRLAQMLGSLDARRPGARPEDRPWLARFLELAPARFWTAVLEDLGCNLSMWNLHDRTLTADRDGALVDGRWRSRFLNLPGFDPDRPYRLNAAASRVRVSASPTLHDICERYASELRACGWSDAEHRGDVGRRLSDDVVYDEALRAIHVSALALGELFEDPFGERGARDFITWLEGPAPRGAAHGVNRYLYHRVARERPDVMRTYPDLDGEDGAEYVAWCQTFGRRELAIPERFMPRVAHAGGRVADRVPPHARRARTESAPPDAVAAQRAADGLAVRLTGYMGHTLGLGAAARGYARALGAAGVSVSTVTVPLHHLELPVALDEGYGTHSFEDLVHEGAHGFDIVAVNADELPDLVSRLGDSYFEGPRIGIWGWETTSIPERWQRAFELIDEIWVYSRFMAENMGAAAPVPVLALPPPIETAGGPADVPIELPQGFLFLFAFDYLSTVQRKNPVGLIEAFKRAFAPGEGPQLLIKTLNAPLRPLAEEEVLWAAHGREDVHVADRSLTREQVSALMARCDCYVSLHRSEGFGLTLAEAMALGKPVIGTGYSGNVDFMDDANSYLVGFTMTRVGAECEIYPPEGEWADPDLDEAAELMREVWLKPEQAAAKGERARADVARLLSPSATGRNMRERLEALASGRAPVRAA